MSEELKSKVRKWLRSHGAPVELQTARAFQKAGFSIRQGSYFVDEKTGKVRESDISAHMHGSASGSPTVTVCVDFLVECKRSRKHPWVAFTISDHELNADSHLAPFTWVMDDLANRDVAYRVSDNWSDMPNIYDSRLTAYSISQARLGDNTDERGLDVPFNAATQLLDAVESRMRKIAKDSLLATRNLLFPVIVFDGQLFEYSLTEEGEILEKRDEITLLLRDRTLSFVDTRDVGAFSGGEKRKVEGFARVKVVTLQALPDFVDRAKAMASWICSLATDIQQLEIEIRERGRTNAG